MKRAADVASDAATDAAADTPKIRRRRRGRGKTGVESTSGWKISAVSAAIVIAAVDSATASSPANAAARTPPILRHDNGQSKESIAGCSSGSGGGWGSAGGE